MVGVLELGCAREGKSSNFMVGDESASNGRPGSGSSGSLRWWA